MKKGKPAREKPDASSTMTKDLFSDRAGHYAGFRPHYPDALYDWLLDHTPGRDTAWDCATGNGQVARALSPHFHVVEASDISAAQLAHAWKDAPNIRYSLQPAERTTFPDARFDLITIGQALHWLDVDAFHREVSRVARPGALLAEWGYGLPVFPVTGIAEALDQFYRETTGPFWEPERRHIDEQYARLPFPFVPVPSPTFSMEAEWDLSQLGGFLSSWSAVQTCVRRTGKDPVPDFVQSLTSLWPDGEVLPLRFPLFLRAGHVTGKGTVPMPG